MKNGESIILQQEKQKTTHHKHKPQQRITNRHLTRQQNKKTSKKLSEGISTKETLNIFKDEPLAKQIDRKISELNEEDTNLSVSDNLKVKHEVRKQARNYQNTENNTNQKKP